MPQLLYSGSSPYSAKVRMAAEWTGFALEPVTVNTQASPPELAAANPLGKIPALVLDDGTALFDSRVITRFLDQQSGGKLFPAGSLAAERLEALADGICDCALAHVYERRMRPEERVHAPWLERQWGKVIQALDFLEANPDWRAAEPDAGTIALRATLAYLKLRFEGQWEAERPGLVAWAEAFDRAHPELAALKPA